MTEANGNQNVTDIQDAVASATVTQTAQLDIPAPETPAKPVDFYLQGLLEQVEQRGETGRRAGRAAKFDFKEADGSISTFIFVYPGVKEAAKIFGDAGRGGVFDNFTYQEALMRKIIKYPEAIKTDTWDYFEDHDGMIEVLNAADEFLERTHSGDTKRG